MKNKKILLSFIIATIFNIIMTNFSFAAEAPLRYNVLYNKNENRYISYNGVSQRFFDYYYVDEVGRKLDAYCITLGLDGAETVEGGYEVNASNYENDQGLINIINNGYPHKSYAELGLESRDEAKFATQFALWIYKSNLDINKIGVINDKSNLVTNAIKNIYYSKDKVRILDDKFELIEKNTEIINKDGKSYYKANFDLEIGNDVVEIEKNETYDNVKIVDEKLEEINKIQDFKTISILYPVEKVYEDIKIEMAFNVKYKNLMLRRGYPDSSNMQDVVLVLPEYEYKSVYNSLAIKYQKMQLEITKIDRETKNPIENVGFKIYNEETDKLLGEFKTDKNGKIKIDFRKELDIHEDIKIRIEESETVEGYKKLEQPIITKLQYGECVKINITNEKEEKKEQNNEEKEYKKIELPKTGM